jgi:hypothetical protein
MQQDGASTSATQPSTWTSQNAGDGHAAGIDIATAFLNGSAAANPSTWTGLTSSASNRLLGATATVLETGGASDPYPAGYNPHIQQNTVYRL